MVERASRYYGDPFQGSWGANQGGPLSPRTLNLLVEAIVRNWVGMVVENKAIPDGFGYVVADKLEFFYADDSLILSTNPVCMQWGFDVLISLFEQVWIRRNVAKMMLMVCQTGPITR